MDDKAPEAQGEPEGVSPRGPSRPADAAKARDRFADTERRYRELVEYSLGLICTHDLTGTILSINPAAAHSLEYQAEDGVGRNLREFLVPDKRPLFDDYLRRLHEQGHDAGLMSVMTRSGAIRVWMYRNVLSHGPNGVPYVLGHAIDITDRITAERTLREREHALRERTAELEYRTTQLSRMASDLTLAEQHAREQIARTLHDGLQQLLVIASLNLEQQLKLDSESGSEPSELLAEAKRHLEDAMAAARSLIVELFPPMFQQSGLPAALTWLSNWAREKYKLQVQLIADPNADPRRKDVRTLLFESVRELLFNAVKYAQTDRVVIELAIDDGDQLCITVSDEGTGFHPTDLDYRSDAGQIGWGLFSIRERLTLLGGRFEVDSAPGKGTRVRLVAPRGGADGPADPRIDVTSAPMRTASADDTNRALPDAVRILIVDDHAAVRSTFRDILNERWQFLVVGEASNGLEAIERADALRPDVILMDIGMPHMDGIEATASIHSELPSIQILGLSMHPRDAAAQAIEQAGAAGFFVKGIDTQRLIEYLLVVYTSRLAAKV